MELRQIIKDAIFEHHKLTGEIVTIETVVTIIKGDTSSIRVQKHNLISGKWVLKQDDMKKLIALFPHTACTDVWVYAE